MKDKKLSRTTFNSVTGQHKDRVTAVFVHLEFRQVLRSKLKLILLYITKKYSSFTLKVDQRLTRKTTGNKKGLRFAPKALIFLELAMGIEPATG